MPRPSHPPCFDHPNENTITLNNPGKDEETVIIPNSETTPTLKSVQGMMTKMTPK
jgi:hypothetical protein